MMRKTLLRVVGAALVAAVPVNAATIYEAEETKIDLYGRLSVDYVYEKENSTEVEAGFQNNGSRLGLRGYHQIEEDLQAYGRFEARFDGSTRTGDFAPRQTYFGLKGNFGDIRVGEFDSLFGDVISDISDIGLSSIWNYHNLGDEHGGGRNLAYYNTVHNVKFGVMATHHAKDRAQDESQAVNWQGTVSIPVAELLTVSMGFNQDRRRMGGMGGTIFGAGVEITPLDALDLGLHAETQKDNATIYGLSCKYGIGPAAVYGYAGRSDTASDNPAEDENLVSVGTSYRFRKGLRAYTEGSYRDPSSGANTTQIAVGARFDF